MNLSQYTEIRYETNVANRHRTIRFTCVQRCSTVFVWLSWLSIAIFFVGVCVIGQTTHKRYVYRSEMNEAKHSGKRPKIDRRRCTWCAGVRVVRYTTTQVIVHFDAGKRSHTYTRHTNWLDVCACTCQRQHDCVCGCAHNSAFGYDSCILLYRIISFWLNMNTLSWNLWLILSKKQIWWPKAWSHHCVCVCVFVCLRWIWRFSSFQSFFSVNRKCKRRIRKKIRLFFLLWSNRLSNRIAHQMPRNGENRFGLVANMRQYAPISRAILGHLILLLLLLRINWTNIKQITILFSNKWQATRTKIPSN